MNIGELLINENMFIINAMERLDKVAKKVLFITEDNQLKASVTDGDIRRWILENGSLDAEVKMAANYNPLYLLEEEKHLAKKLMKEHSIEAIPILNSSHQIISVILWDDSEILKNSENISLPVVIMAGGLGTRLYPYTRILPKPLIPIGEIPIAEHIINRFHMYGCNDYYFIVNHKKNMIKAYFNEIEKDYNVYYIDEDTPLGTGGGLSLLKGKINSTFILSNCDILIKEDISKICKFHKEKGHLITMVCSAKHFKIPYGIITIGKNGEIDKMQEKPELSFLTNTGVYIVEPQVIESMECNCPVGFPDIIDMYKKHGQKIGVYPISEKAWLDMGEISELEKMTNLYDRGSVNL